MPNSGLLPRKLISLFFLRSISTLLLCSFAFQEISYASPELLKVGPASWAATDGQKEKQGNIAWAKKLLPAIPESVATVEDAWFSSSYPKKQNDPAVPGDGGVPQAAGPGDSLVILVQDAHTNTSCQANESKLFDLLFQNHVTDTVFTEAAKGNVNLTFLREKASLAQRKQIANEYLQKGFLHGIEYLDLTSEHDFIIEGVEDPALYVQSLKVYQQSAKKRESFQRYLQEIESTIQTLTPKLLNPFLLAFLEKYKKAKTEQTSLSDYLDTLFSQADILNIATKDYPQLQKLKELKTLESKIDFKAASIEQQKAIESLNTQDRKELIDSIAPSKLSMKDSQRGFVLSLNEKLKDKTLYPELAKYLRYFDKSKSLNPKQILSDKKRLEDQIFKSLATGQDESKLLLAIKTLDYYKKLFHLSLTPEEYEEFKKEDFADLKTLSGFLNKKLMSLKDHYDKTIFLNNDFNDMAALCRKFYELTYQRDEKFLENMESALSVKRQALKGDKDSNAYRLPLTAILITGGYHTPNLKYLLKKKNISYISITPQVFHETNITRYEEILLGRSVAVNKPGYLPKASTIGKLAMTEYFAGNAIVRSSQFSGVAGPFYARFGGETNYSLRAARLAGSNLSRRGFLMGAAAATAGAVVSQFAVGAEPPAEALPSERTHLLLANHGGERDFNEDIYPTLNPLMKALLGGGKTIHAIVETRHSSFAGGLAIFEALNPAKPDNLCDIFGNDLYIKDWDMMEEDLRNHAVLSYEPGIYSGAWSTEDVARHLDRIDRLDRDNPSNRSGSSRSARARAVLSRINTINMNFEPLVMGEVKPKSRAVSHEDVLRRIDEVFDRAYAQIEDSYNAGGKVPLGYWLYLQRPESGYFRAQDAFLTDKGGFSHIDGREAYGDGLGKGLIFHAERQSDPRTEVIARKVCDGDLLGSAPSWDDYSKFGATTDNYLPAAFFFGDDRSRDIKKRLARLRELVEESIKLHKENILWKRDRKLVDLISFLLEDPDNVVVTTRGSAHDDSMYQLMREKLGEKNFKTQSLSTRTQADKASLKFTPDRDIIAKLCDFFHAQSRGAFQTKELAERFNGPITSYSLQRFVDTATEKLSADTATASDFLTSVLTRHQIYRDLLNRIAPGRFRIGERNDPGMLFALYFSLSERELITKPTKAYFDWVVIICVANRFVEELITNGIAKDEAGEFANFVLARMSMPLTGTGGIASTASTGRGARLANVSEAVAIGAPAPALLDENIIKGQPIEQDDELVFAIHVYSETKEEGRFAVTGNAGDALNIVEVKFNETTDTLIVRFNNDEPVEVKNYKAVLARDQESHRLEEVTLTLSRKELKLAQADLKFEFTQQTNGIQQLSDGFVTKKPKLIKLDLPGFMNDKTKATDSRFIEWLIHSMHQARENGAFLVLENGTNDQVETILTRASQLYPGVNPSNRFIFSSNESLPDVGGHSATLVALDPDAEQILPENNLYVIAKKLDGTSLHNVSALIQTAVAQAEVGLSGITNAKSLTMLRGIYYVLGIEVVPEDSGEFAKFLQGKDLTRDRINLWAIAPFNVGDILRAYALGARMAEQAA